MKVSNLIAVASLSFLMTPALAGVTKIRPSAHLAKRPPAPTSDTVPPSGDAAPPASDQSPTTFVDRPQSQEAIAPQGHAVIYARDPIAQRPVRNAFVRILPLDAPSGS